VDKYSIYADFFASGQIFYINLATIVRQSWQHWQIYEMPSFKAALLNVNINNLDYYR
jgi:hypothetical protein